VGVGDGGVGKQTLKGCFLMRSTGQWGRQPSDCGELAANQVGRERAKHSDTHWSLHAWLHAASAVAAIRQPPEVVINAC